MLTIDFQTMPKHIGVIFYDNYGHEYEPDVDYANFNEAFGFAKDEIEYRQMATQAIIYDMDTDQTLAVLTWEDPEEEIDLEDEW